MRNKILGAGGWGGLTAGASASNFNFDFPRALFAISLLLWGARESLYWLVGRVDFCASF